MRELLPPPSMATQQYNLRRRPHDRQMPDHTRHLADKNFLIRMLLKDSYWLFYVVTVYSQVSAYAFCHVLIKKWLTEWPSCAHAFASQGLHRWRYPGHERTKSGTVDIIFKRVSSSSRLFVASKRRKWFVMPHNLIIFSFVSERWQINSMLWNWVHFCRNICSLLLKFKPTHSLKSNTTWAKHTEIKHSQIPPRQPSLQA